MSGFLLFAACVPLSAAPVINEIMFHPVSVTGSEASAEEFIEIFNPEARPADLSGWRLTAGVRFTFPAGTVISPGDYLVVCANTGAFLARHPGVTNITGNWTGSLSNRHDRVELSDGAGAVADEVNYATEGDWALRRRPSPVETDPPSGDLFAESHGWIWRAPADGAGNSMELRQPALNHDSGQNWQPSAAAGGTPGAANSARTANLPPMILNTCHHPAVPAPGEPVTVRVDVADESYERLAVTLNWRVAAPVSGAFVSIPMKDDGIEADERAVDGVFAGRIPAQAAGEVVEFYISATDGVHSRTWPPPTDEAGAQSANCLYQVDDAAAPNALPVYRMVLTPAYRREFDSITDTNTNAVYNATFVYRNGEDTAVRYQAGMRLRGSGSRDRLPRSVRLDLSNDRTWEGWDAMNLNSQFPWLQVLGSHFAKSAGLRAADQSSDQW